MEPEPLLNVNSRLPVLFKTGRLARLCGLDLVQQAAISRKPLINSLGTGNRHFDQNIFSPLAFLEKTLENSCVIIMGDLGIEL